MSDDDVIIVDVRPAAKRLRPADDGPAPAPAPHPPADPALEGLFLTAVTGISEPSGRILTLPQLLRGAPSDPVVIGPLLESAQFNFMIDGLWLRRQYEQAGVRLDALTVVTGESGGSCCDMHYLSGIAKSFKHVKARLHSKFGTHHTKMMLLRFSSGLRVVIHTANLIQNDWDQKTQGIWVSPVFPVARGNGPHDSSTGFRQSLLEYLSAYGKGPGEVPVLQPLISLVSSHDMHDARAVIIASIPGYHKSNDMDKWGHRRLARVLASQGASLMGPVTEDTLICQFSSIGSLGKEMGTWLGHEFAGSLSSTASPAAANPALRLVYPAVDDVRESLEGYSGGGCLPYGSQTAAKQTWLAGGPLLNRWVAGNRRRSRAVPHIKTYARVHKQGHDFRAAWVLVSSHNLSKAAWGATQKARTQLQILSYELGVLLIPAPGSTFSARDCLPYDLPLTPYRDGDRPWLSDVMYAEPDIYGKSRMQSVTESVTGVTL